MSGWAGGDGLAFKAAVLAVDGGCRMAEVSECEDGLVAHHVVTQQQLRRHGLPDLVTSPENGIALCERHHRRHHNRREPVLRAVLPQRVLDFADSLGLAYLIDRFYASAP